MRTQEKMSFVLFVVFLVTTATVDVRAAQEKPVEESVVLQFKIEILFYIGRSDIARELKLAPAQLATLRSKQKTLIRNAKEGNKIDFIMFAKTAEKILNSKQIAKLNRWAEYGQMMHLQKGVRPEHAKGGAILNGIKLIGLDSKSELALEELVMDSFRKLTERENVIRQEAFQRVIDALAPKSRKRFVQLAGDRLAPYIKTMGNTINDKRKFVYIALFSDNSKLTQALEFWMKEAETVAHQKEEVVSAWEALETEWAEMDDESGRIDTRDPGSLTHTQVEQLFARPDWARQHDLKIGAERQVQKAVAAKNSLLPHQVEIIDKFCSQLWLADQSHAKGLHRFGPTFWPDILGEKIGFKSTSKFRKQMEEISQVVAKERLHEWKEVENEISQHLTFEQKEKLLDICSNYDKCPVGGSNGYLLELARIRDGVGDLEPVSKDF